MFSQIEDCKCKKNRGESLLPYRNQTRDESAAATLDEREIQGFSTKHLAQDEFCKDNHYI